jgi:hypothetical protein
MNIDDLTLGQIREIQAMACAPKKGKALAIESKRVILVVDRGWIFAGDQSLTTDGYIRLDNAVHVRSWSGVGFDGVVSMVDPSKVVLKKMAEPVEVPRNSVIFRVPVSDKWGL